VRVAVVDIGTNSTRLLVADVTGGRVDELERSSTVTRLGQGVDAAGRLAPEAMDRVFAVLARYREKIDELGAGDATTGVLTSAVRDAENGAEFTAQVRDRFGLDARTIAGDEEAQLTFAGATSRRDPHDDTPTLVIDIGGGSTELVIGTRGEVEFHVSTQAGVVRQTERHISTDPPDSRQLAAIAGDAQATIEAAVPEAVRRSAKIGVAVAGTAASLAAIDQALEPYDPARAHGYELPLAGCERMLERLAAIPLADRRAVPGLHPDRAPTILAGAVILIAVMRCFGLDRVEVSEHDILHGAALVRASAG
jgi:exopolyphosphatase/guanosine-5'-triphosphate,3'-diphosphate pyrophosphatase